ncbi:BspA family leucine-rich repeat surface protein [Mangrovimonas xylaniphaga]|uniref:BspA family leucine-rich repeat surface protein n=1 Tax=Mangrovimonas xylaniphaga TaxID=1645915 RepID=UPI0006B59BCE|nr:BspA family leucine-rich repeat surface protein [Mangrovimonas xylaniphaga]
MKQTYLFLMIMLWATITVAQAPFITTWEVTTYNLHIQFGDGNYEGGNYTVDFGDGTILTNQSGIVEHTYGASGTYTVSVSGGFYRFLPESSFATRLKSIEQWGDVEWKIMEGAFKGCSNLVINATDAPNLSQVTSMKEMFRGCNSLVNVPGIEAWDVSSVTNMKQMFWAASNFNQSIEAWDVSNVTNMSGMFHAAQNFNQPLNSWDVSNVSIMDGMFGSASSFNEPLDAWDVSNVTNMDGVFSFAMSFNQPLNTWDVSNVTNMYTMFHYAQSFNQPLDAWNVSSVTDMNHMFGYAKSFNQPLGVWDVSNVTNMGGMFREAANFNQPLNAWDVSNVTNMDLMFTYATNFNQPLDNWDFSNIDVNLNHFVSYTGLSVANYDLLLEHLTEFNLPISYMGAVGLYYCNQAAHDYLTNDLNWYIPDEGISDTCASISGEVLFDIDNNGCSETGIPMGDFFVTMGNGSNSYAQFVSDGSYYISTNIDTWTVSLMNVPNYYTVTPESIEVDFESTSDEIVDFCITANQDINDLNITLLPTGQARPGFEAAYKLVVKNLGTQSMDNITASLTFDEAMQSFVEANPVTSATTTNSLEFAIATLAPFEIWETSITMQTFTPPTVNGDDLLNFTATVLPNTDDYTPNDNTFSLEQIVVNSYDPNDKQVLQGETIVMEQTSEYLDYLIRFQNTGSASAINIRVEDELHDNLDWSTLSITSASHDYEVEITNGNEVDFVFNGIYLPAESQNEPESHGYIAYKIKPKTTVQVGDIMSGNASIYFDYNAPIITNTVTTEVVDVLGVGEYNLSSFITVYPNPISEGVYLEMNDGVELISAKLYNVQGRLLLETKEATNYIKTEQLSSGVYMLRLETNKGQLVKRVVNK